MVVVMIGIIATVHEFGHLAGLEHRGSFGNLMQQGALGKQLSNNQLQDSFNRRGYLNQGSNSAALPMTGQKIPNNKGMSRVR